MKTIYLSALLTILVAVNTVFAQTKDSLQAYPNPFACNLTIGFEVPQDDTITLAAYNIQGQVEAAFYTNKPLKRGSYTYVWRADTVSDGIYMLNYQRGSRATVSKKIIKNGSCATANIATANSADIAIYPNPTTGILMIPVKGEKQLIITDLTGRILKQFTTSSEQISIADLSAGTYMLTLILTYDKTVKVQKITKVN